MLTGEGCYRQPRSLYRWEELADRPSREQFSGAAGDLPGWNLKIAVPVVVAVTLHLEYSCGC